MKKLTKTQVKSIANKQGEILVRICPSNCYPDPVNPLDVSIEKVFSKTEILSGYFDNFIQTFKFYNCNKETGKTVHYYQL